MTKRLLVPGVIGSTSKLSANRKNFHVVLLEAKYDKIISYDLKRHAPVKLKALPKAFSILINNSYFPLYKLISINSRLVFLTLSDNNIVVNLENLYTTEDKDYIDLYKHNHSQRENLVIRDQKNCATDRGYGVGLLHDIKCKPQRSVVYIWSFCSYLDHHQDNI